MSLIGLRNWVRMYIKRENPLCPECGAVMIKNGHPKGGFIQYYKCPECGGEPVRREAEEQGEGVIGDDGE